MPIVRKAAIHAGIISSESDVFPIIQRSGINKAGKAIRYFFNYSSESKEITHNYPTSKELISGKTVKEGDHVTIAPPGNSHHGSLLTIRKHEKNEKKIFAFYC